MKNSINNRFISLFTVFSLILMTVFNTPGFSMIASALSNNIWNGTESAVPAKGSCSESDPYIIETPAELYYVVFEAGEGTKNKYYQLANNIYLNDTSKANWESNSPNVWSSKTSPNNEPNFLGHFDGNGYVVHGIYTNNTNKKYWYRAALFPHIWASSSDVSIKNVGVEDSSVNGKVATAAIVGYISGSDEATEKTVTVSGCYADESVNVNGTNNAGGLVGCVDFKGNFVMENCYSRVRLGYTGSDGKTTLGSLVGMFDKEASMRSVSNCYVIINTEDFDKGFNAIPTGTTATDNVTYTNVHAGNEGTDIEKIQRGSAQQAVIIRRWASDFKGFEVKKKIPLFDYTDTWYSDLNGGYLLLKIFNKSQLSGTYDNSKFGGEGTEESPYIIDTDEKLAILRCVSPELTEGKVYNLSNDISVNNQGDEKRQATSVFLGTFDGDGHIIKGLNIDGSQHSFAALFNALGDGAVVANVGIETSYIEGVNSSAIAGDVFGNNVSIRNCYAGDGVRINGSTTVGGIIGQVRGKYFTMTNCFFTGTFIGNAEQEAGLAGKLEVEENYLKTVTFSNCYAATSDNNLAIPSSLNINKIRCLNLYGTVEQPSVDTSSSNVIFKIVSKENMTGNSAAVNMTLLDFYSTWIAKEGTTPRLRIFTGDIDRNSGTAGAIWSGRAATDYASGKGTKEDPYIIETAEQLALLVRTSVYDPQQTADKYYKLANNIFLNDTSADEWYTSETANEWFVDFGYDSIGFQGNFNGNGYTVYGIYYSAESYLQYTGLIPHASEWGDGEYTVTVKNIGIKDSYINGINAGAVVGIASGNNNNKVLVTGCYADESVMLNGINAEGDWGASGLVAMVDNPNFTMEDCFSRVKRAGYTKSDEARGSLIGLVYVDTSTSFDNANRVLIKNCYAVITKEDYDKGFSVVPENWAELNVHYVNVHGEITPDGSNVENGYKANHNGIQYSEETILSHWPSDFRKTALLSGFDSNVWLPGDGDQSYMLQKIFNKQGYSLKSDKVKITFNLLDGTVKELVGYPGNTISWSEIQNNDLVDWYLECKCLTKFEYDVFPDYDITLYAKLKISAWNGQASSGFGGGDGSEASPYIIKDGSQLYYMLTSFDTSGKFFRITEDIYLNDITDINWRSNPKRWISSDGSSNVFKGTLDGEGHTVYGVYCDSAGAEYAGLIPVLSAASGNVSVTNLKLNDFYIRGKNVGGLIGIISSSSSSVTVSACYVGKNVEISGSSSQGGIIGQLENSVDTIKNCAFVGTISGNNLGKEKQGGLIGYSLVSADNAKNVKIQNSFAVTGNNIPVSSATASGVNAVFTNVYGNHVDGYGLSGITQVAENDMMNSVAQKYMPGLEFNTVWQVGVNSYPELVLFENGKKGDVNNDSKINIIDLVRYKKITAGSVNADIKDADLNNDSRIDSSELTLTKKYLLDLYQPETKVNEEITSFKTGKKYKLVWNDEFDGDSIDYNKWGYGYVNSSFSKYLSLKTQEDDSSVIGARNGQLQLNGKRYFDTVDNTVKYASSISLETQGTMNFKYGYLEMRAKVPLRKGGFPALWATGIPGLVSKKSNDYYVEIDIFESLGGRKIESNFHKWYTSLGGASTVIDLNRLGVVPGNTKYTQLWLTAEQRRVLPYEYHTYSMEWTPEYLKTYFDDTEICSIDLTVTYDANWDEPNGNGAGSGIKIPQEYRNMDGFHDYIGLLIQNIVIGIDEGGQDDDIAVKDDTKFDFEYYIDYIRLYQGPNVNESGLVYLNENGEKVDYYKNSK